MSKFALNTALPRYLREEKEKIDEAAALYQEGRERFALTQAAGARREWSEELEMDSLSVTLPAEHGVYLFDRDSRSTSRSRTSSTS